MKSGWITKTLDQIAENLDSKRIPITKANRTSGPYPYYGASGIVDYVGEYIFDGDSLLVSEDGANLLARATPIAFPATGKYWVNNHAHVLKFDDLTTQRWVELYLESIPLDEYITGAAQPKLNQKALNSIPIPLASVQEQRRIVAILDEAFEAISEVKANAEKNLLSVESLLAQRVDELFQCPAVQQAPAFLLGELASFRNGINFDRHSKGQSVRIVGVKDFQQNFDAPTDDLEWVVVEGELSLADRVEPGDIVFVRSNGNPELIGRCLLIGQMSEPTTHSGFTIKMRLKGASVNPRFACHFLKSTSVRRQLVEGGNGASIKSLNQGTLSAVRLPVPSLDVQSELVEHAETLKREAIRLTAIYERKLAALDELKNSLLAQAFSGQLTARQPLRVAQPQALQTATPQFTAGVIALAYARHVKQQREKTFGRVKEQKVLHLVESIAKVNLGRQPMKDAAGPNDFQHMLRAEQWAKQHSFFEMVERGQGYDFKPLKDFDKHLLNARQELGPHLIRIEEVIDLLVPMDSQDAEVFATVHAAWNNLLMDGVEATESRILKEARDSWHPDKLLIPEHKFKKAIELVRRKNLIPDGTGKYVTGQRALL
ncbi:MAG: restriction endonuclease subunit S [Aquabacterium sp.]|uniref:restriction endonuclease subunit S n=1 Tax=Aquabacterium sp. TaxID=1872578 RepID=UPI0025BA4751|nr:restriction endonuclease subunit S [Aquabacterium sp.]MBI5926146.1 restriction endonuclease subunit S [Aquabacterium sp.]